MRVATFAEQISAIAAVKINEPMSLHTTFRIGGPADFYAQARDLDELKQLYCLAQEYEMPFFLLGTGSNILVSDLGIRGLVVENKARTLHVQVDRSRSRKNEEPTKLLRVESGYLLGSLARETARLGLEGVEWAAGIPGTLGGAIVYNAGAYGGCISNVLRSVRIIKSNGNIAEAQLTDLQMGYRSSIFTHLQTKMMKNPPVILEAELSLRKSEKLILEERIARHAEHRKLTQPRGASAGSVFKNPVQHSAGWLIEQVGLKGHRLGDAQISTTHANFIINTGHATAVEVERLISLAREKVMREFDTQLEMEIGLVGERIELR